MKLEDWIARIETSNLLFEQLNRERIEQLSQRTPLKMKNLRQLVDEQYRLIIARISAYITLGEEELYHHFVIEHNVLTQQYRNLLAHRKGMAKAKNEL